MDIVEQLTRAYKVTRNTRFYEARFIIENRWHTLGDHRATTASQDNCFDWSKSVQGYKYWSDIYDQLARLDLVS